jgi:hypothetical protein
MKQLRIYFYIILCVPMLAGFSQANLGVGVNCIQCMLSVETQPSCCQNNAPSERADECSAHAAFSKTPCPHNELCQSLDSPAVATANSTFARHLGYGISSYSVVEPSVFSPNVKDIAIRPPLLQVNRKRYTLLCSFLI